MVELKDLITVGVDLEKVREQELAEELFEERSDKLVAIKKKLTKANAVVRKIQKEKQEIEYEMLNLITNLPDNKYVWNDRQYELKQSIRVTRTVNFDKLWNDHPEIYKEYVVETKKYIHKLSDTKYKEKGGK